MSITTTSTPTITYTNQTSKGFFEPPTQSGAIYALNRLHTERSESSLVSMENSRPQEATDWKIKKFELQNIARKILPYHAIRKCLCWRVPGKSVEIWKGADGESAHFRNVITCKNVWVCAVCSSRITEKRAQELQGMLEGTDYQTIMTTFTMSHNRGEKLEDLLSDMQDALRAFKSGRWWQDLCEEWGIVGTIKALEVTWGDKNGWHPHIHELWVLDLNNPLSEAQSLHLQHLLVERWRTMLAKFGRSASDDRGVHVSPNAIDQYIAKFGKEPKPSLGKWTLAREVSKAASKRSMVGTHLTPFQILDLAEDDLQMAAVFREYASAMKGKQQLRWSTGLRDLLGLAGDGEDMPEDSESEKIITIPDAHWQSVVNERKRGDLLKIAVSGTVEDIRLFINICHYRQLAKIKPRVHVLQHRKQPEHGHYE